MNPWSNLPNARHIDAVLASVKANPKIWAEAWAKAGGWTEARTMALNAVWNESRDAAWNAAVGAAITMLGAAWAAESVILALLAYDDCAHLLNTNPEHVKMLAGLGDEAAILLYPAVLLTLNTSGTIIRT